MLEKFKVACVPRKENAILGLLSKLSTPKRWGLNKIVIQDKLVIPKTDNKAFQKMKLRNNE